MKRGRLFLRVAAAFLALVAIGFGVALGTSSAPYTATATTPQCNPILGVYAGPGNPPRLGDFVTSMSCKTAYAMDFLDASSWETLSNPTWFMQRWRGSGYRMIWGVPMLLDSGTTLAAEAAGDYDTYFKELAQVMVESGQGSSIIRLGWEFNCCGAWYAIGQAGNFIAAYQHVVDDFRSVTGEDFKFEWNPTLANTGSTSLADYYPGDAYVDYVGEDLYDGGWGTYTGISSEFSTWETESGGLDWLASFSKQHDKPIIFGEWGLGWGDCSTGGQRVSDPNTNVCGGDDPSFINDMYQWVTTHNVAEITFWDYGTSSVDHDANSSTMAALIGDFAPGATPASAFSADAATANPAKGALRP